MSKTKQVNCKVRLIEKKDLENIAILTKNVGWFNRENKSYEEDYSKNVEAMFNINKKNINNICFVAENKDNKFLGYVNGHFLPYYSFKSQELFITELFVVEEERGKGVGKKLLDKILIEAKKRKCFRLGLLNPKEKESYKREFYKKAGWEERTHIANFILKLK